MSQTSMLYLNQIGKRYQNGTEALRGMNMEVEQGAFVSLLGPSGCGKSTLLKIIAGLANQTSGQIVWPGLDGEGPGRPEGEISFVFQEPTLMQWASVFDNVWLPLRLKGQSRSAARQPVDEALAMVGLSEFANSYPRELSSGMKMRVSIARALVTRPKLMLMDEPFAALDEITRFKLNNDLLELWKKFGWTVLFVTHSVFESAYLANRIVVMAARPGHVVEDIGFDAAYPRDQDFRKSAQYTAMCGRALDALHLAKAADDQRG